MLSLSYKLFGSEFESFSLQNKICKVLGELHEKYIEDVHSLSNVFLKVEFHENVLYGGKKYDIYIPDATRIFTSPFGKRNLLDDVFESVKINKDKGFPFNHRDHIWCKISIGKTDNYDGLDIDYESKCFAVPSKDGNDFICFYEKKTTLIEKKWHQLKSYF